MPTNTYGRNDSYDLETSHVLPALIRKAHDAKLRNDAEYIVWGTGNVRREFIYVDDLADACVYLAQRGYEGSLINVGCGADISIRDLAELVIVYDAAKPDGTARKLLDVGRLSEAGWRASISLSEGIRLAYDCAPFVGRAVD
jgi:GDP-L-fucose synthase